MCNSLGFEVQKQKKRGSGNNRVYRNLKLVVSDLRASLGAEKIEKILFLRLNSHLIPGLGKVVRELESLKEERDGAFIAKTTAVASSAL